MKKHLSAAGIERVKLPKQGTTEIFDLGYPGLALRIGHGGAKSFQVFFRDGGKQVRRSLGRWPGTSLAQAREEWRRIRECIARGEQPANREGAKTPPAMLFENVVEDWLKRDQSQ
ncbi:MAG TPA: Arm DNA-binding domain-containing protein, partial [Methyloceanibacter sp.]|nr:Arm DNA-binding domain-containing protein [Methyloceanibacter sp.]